MTTTHLFEEIPSLDLHAFTKGSEEEQRQFVKALGDAYENIGFVAIKNHGLSDSQTARLYDIIQMFFALSDDSKKQYEIEGIFGQRGYVSKGKEKAKGRNTGDLKEFYHVGQPDERKLSEYPGNIWPAEVPEMQNIALEVFDTLQNAGIELLRAIALYLELPKDYFDNKVVQGNSILRAIHYFPIEDPDSIPDDAVRAAEHGDINLITLLMGASADGLEVLRRDGKWIPITALPDQIIVNVGDMLSRHTNNKLKSTIHRVVNPPRDLMGTPRYSIPFFMHPISSMDLTCLDSCIDESHPKQFKDVTAGEYLQERLKQIGLKA